MWTRAVSGYTAATVDAALHAAVGRRRWTFRYDLLDVSGNVKKALANVYNGSITYSTTAAIRRTAQFQIVDDPDINFLQDRIRPYARLRMPDGGYAEWPVGTFLLSTPPRQLVESTLVRSVQGYDFGQILADDKVTDRYTIGSGTVVTTAIAYLLTSAGLNAQNVQASAATLPTTQDWAMGTTKAKIVADLLNAINYAPLWFDALGVAQVLPFVAQPARAVEYTYANDRLSVIFAGMQDGLDLFNVPNVFVLAVSQPDRSVLRSVYTNSNPSSPTSTVSRGRSITMVDTSQNAVDQATLDALAQRAAYNASQVAETAVFTTALMPFHGNEDVYTLQHSKFGINGPFMETSWLLPLKVGGQMQHTAQRIVSV